MPRHSRASDVLRRPAAYAIAVLGVAVALWIELLLPDEGRWLSLTPFSLAVAFAVWYGGFGAGILALLLSALAIDFFLLDPGTLLQFDSSARAAIFCVYLAGWLAFCVMADGVYRRTRRDREVRKQAEAVARQADRLSQLTNALGQARTEAAVIEACVQEPLHALEADAGMLVLISNDGATAELARAVTYREEELERWRHIDLTEKSMISDAVGRGAPVLLESRERRSAEYAGLPEAGHPSDFDAAVAVPLVIGSRVAAVVRLDFRKPQVFTRDDHEYLFTLGPRAAQALDRTWQFDFAQRARIEAESLRARADQELSERQKIELALRASEGRYRALAARTSRLHGLSAALSEAVTLDAVGQAVVRQGKIVVGATTGEVALLTDDGTQFETLFSEGDGHSFTEPQRYPAESGLCATQAIATRQPVFVGSFEEWQERYWLSASIAADGGFVSSATLPLLVEGRAIGVLAFYFTAPVNFDDEYQALMVSVAQHCAQALDRARLYESAQRARADAEAANRLKDEFVSIVSHELRTPLNAILGWTSMLRKGSLDGPVAERALQSVHDNATRQTRLIDELLDFSRMLGGRIQLDMEEIDVRDLIRGVVESMLPMAAAAGLDLHVSAMPAVKVTGDRRRLEQVFFNLLGNAVKFTPAGGRIGVDAAVADAVLELRVTDTGVGIEPEFLPHVFDRFRQADGTTTRNFGGLGLGLSIARQLVEAHKGTIGVESGGKDRGSTFIVALPIAGYAAVRPEEPAASQLQAEATGATSPCLDGVRVLVVDDEPDAREIMAHALRSCGADVTIAGSARDAHSVLERDEIDVLLADIAMPDEDGYALIRSIRTSQTGRIATIPAVAVTAHARDDERRQALAAGFHHHLAKPFEPTQLARTVEMLVRGTPLTS